MFEQQLTQYICQNFGLDQSDFDRDTNLVESGILDSFSMVEIVTFVENLADVKYGAFDLTVSNLESIGAIMRFVERKSEKTS